MGAAEAVEAKAKVWEETKATTGTFALPDGLFDQAADRYERANPGQKPTSQRVIDFCVEEHLAEIRILLRRMGFRYRPPGKPKPRRISRKALESLKGVSAESGISTAALLRACLEGQ